ncbi:MAG: hypothetical protein R3E83_19280 [Burkholderiaceae bacterium]
MPTPDGQSVCAAPVHGLIEFVAPNRLPYQMPACHGHIEGWQWYRATRSDLAEFVDRLVTLGDDLANYTETRAPVTADGQGGRHG